MTQLMHQLIERLRSIPEAEQDDVAGSLIEELSARDAPDDAPTRPYAFLHTLRDANLELRPDASVTYERDLYGREADLD